MRRLVVAVAAVTVAVGTGFVYANGLREPEPADQAVIVLTDRGFEPESVHISKGGAVTFKTERDKPFWPASDLHPAHGLYPEFDPLRPLDPGETWTFRFNRAGEWGFHDHLRSYFVGTIYVAQ